MSRPQIIRADTLDLQDHDAPSAKDHTRQPTHPAPLGAGAPSPHQAGAIKQAEEQSVEQLSQMPPVSDEQVNGEYSVFHEERQSFDDLENELGHPAHQQPQQNQDHQAVQMNGGLNGSTAEDVDMADAESDDGLEDDMMDKISSSPSIDDGGYSLPSPWPARADSLTPISTRSFTSPNSPSSTNVEGSSSPFLSTPVHFPLFYSQQEDRNHSSPDNHLQGGYSGRWPTLALSQDFEDESRDHLSPLVSEQRFSHFQEEFDECPDNYDKDFETENIHDLLLPSEDPLLDNSFDNVALQPSQATSTSSSSDSSWESDEGYHEDSYQDDAEDISFSDDTRFTDSGWGGECLRETEDIDFEFVYALHTFVATVEGQANATKGDTMVLLDDSNSYWWLVKVAKDSSIGYLPAEHIETPTERLARLNKHRNIDLSATMLGDNPEKSKNPLKKAMRRRNAKTVQFSAPTYVEASDVDYSSDEEDPDGDFYSNGDESAQNQDGQQEDQDIITAVEPLNVTQQSHERASELLDPANGASDRAEVDGKDDSDMARTSDEMFDRQIDGVSPKSRHGVVRNTDSFFKDDNVETRKITLTPNLLRDDSSNSTPRTSESKEVKPRGSLENLEKSASPPDKAKDDKKKKEKKSGMLSGLFKRKDKKIRSAEDDTDDAEKISSEISTDSPQWKGSDESSLETQALQSSPKSTKLQKQPPVKPGFPREQPLAQTSASKQPPTTQIPAPNRPPPTTAINTPTMRLVQPNNEPSSDGRPAPLRVQQAEPQVERNISPEAKDTNESSGMFAPITNMLRSSSTDHSHRPEKVKKAKTRVELDDFDSSPDVDQPPDPLRHMPGAGPEEEHTSTKERLSESPIQVSPAEAPTTHPPPLMVDTSSQEEPSISPVSPPSSPELIDRNEAHAPKAYEGTPDSTAQSSTATPTWSDASLRMYLEDGRDIKDLLVVVHDKTGVVPAGPDHPITGKLFTDENKKLAEISNRLDGVLGDWLARKTRVAAR
ncbi:MAG: hypothetical protein M1812_004367 [Candelaria pacifica]|nr:MAG: hypothetical protein M1812_004367 [Candelaria pacifica]